MKFLLLCLLTPLSIMAQTLPDSTARKIDNIFRAFKEKTPGCAVAVVKDGAVVFSKGYGEANLEYSVPIKPNTSFHIASESKQYVAFCMLLLQKEGKLSLDDDIRKHLDFVPDFGHKITIRHLIHHTSGLRDQWQLLANAGWQLDDVITQDHVIKLVTKQKALNFIPGSEMLYCNTGYTLMAEIVKKVSGLSLRAYANKNIFQPLGMTDTHFHDDYKELVPGRAYSYAMSPKGYQHAVLSYSIVGATSLHTTVLDEAKWLNNYESGTVGGKDLIEKMYELAVLNDGRKLIYAFALNIDTYKGWQQIGHGGGDAGFRTFACRFPEKKLGIVVFSNSGTVNPQNFTQQIANLFIPTEKEAQKPVPKTFVDSVLFKKLQGRYYSERGDNIQISFQNGQLISKNLNGGGTMQMTLEDLGNNRYQVNGRSVMVLNDKNPKADSVQSFESENYGSRIYYKRQPAAAKPLLSEFTGKFFGEETEAFYYVTEKNGQLTLSHRKYPDVILQMIAPDQFNSGHWWMNHIRFLRDKKGKVNAFEVNAGRIMHLRYDKVRTAD